MLLSQALQRRGDKRGSAARAPGGTLGHDRLTAWVGAGRQPTKSVGRTAGWAIG